MTHEKRLEIGTKVAYVFMICLSGMVLFGIFFTRWEWAFIPMILCFLVAAIINLIMTFWG